MGSSPGMSPRAEWTLGRRILHSVRGWYLQMIWVQKPMNTTAGWVGWSQGFVPNSAHEAWGAKRGSGLSGMLSLIHSRSNARFLKRGPTGAIIILPRVLCLSTSLPLTIYVRLLMDEASCAGPWSRPYFVIMLRVSVVHHLSGRRVVSPKLS